LGTVALSLSVRSVKTHVIAWASVLTTVLLYVVLGVTIGPRVSAEWKEVRERFPLESLSPRLAYETQSGRQPAPLPEGERKEGKAWKRLTEVEEHAQGKGPQWYSQRRARSIEMAHAGFVKQFVDAPGFGAARMLRRPRPYSARAREDDGDALKQ